MSWTATYRKPQDVPDGWAAGFNVDRPSSGDRRDGYELTIGGWAVGRIARAEEIQVLHDGCLLRRAPVGAPRPDVAALIPDEPSAARSGFRIRVGLLGLPPAAELELCVALADGSPLHIGTLTVTHTPLAIEPPPRLSPVIVTSLGRMGTTLLMSLLAQHPEVVVHPQYPYELGAARYLVHLLGVACAPADHLDSSHPDSFSQETNKMGHNPFFGDFLAADEETNHWFSSRAPVLMGAWVQQATDEFYECLAARAGHGSARFFAEKSLPDHLPYLFHDLYPEAREIVLVRDIRDVVCSALAFNAKRGNSSFGREWLDDDLGFVEQLRQDLERLVVSWRRRSERALLVRYEDLVIDPIPTIAAIFDHIGVATDSPLIEAALAAANASSELQTHRTSASPEASIGRWASELAEERPGLLERCHDLCGDLLTELGYDVPKGGRRGPELERSLAVTLASFSHRTTSGPVSR
jgi:hypothetical protein